MSVLSRKVRCILPIVIVFLVCWMLYWTFDASSKQVVDLNKIQGSLPSSSKVDSDSSLKFKDGQKFRNVDNQKPADDGKLADFGKRANYRKAANDGKPAKDGKPASDGKGDLEGDFGEVDMDKRNDTTKGKRLNDNAAWIDDKDYYSDDDKKDTDTDGTDVKRGLEKDDGNDDDEYIQFEDLPTTTTERLSEFSKAVDKRFGLVNRARSIAPSRRITRPPEVEFVGEPVWRTVAKNAPENRGKEREPATPFPNAFNMPRKKSNILSQFTPEAAFEKPKLNAGGNGILSGSKDRKKTSSLESYYVMLHSGDASLVHSEMNSDLQYMPDDIPSSAYIFTSKYLPSDVRLRPSVGNGRIATVVHSPELYFSGLYNGRLSDSHRAAIPSTCSFNITGTEPPSNFTRYYSLNVGAGIYVETAISRDYNFTYKLYAHRNISSLMVIEVDLERSNVKQPLTLKVDLNRWTASYDFTFRTEEHARSEVSYKVGKLNAPETADSPDVELHVMYDHVPPSLVASPHALRTKWVFLTAYGSTKEEVEQVYDEGVSLIHGKDELFASHVRAWGHLWSRGRVDIKDNLTLARAAYGSWYYLLSSLPLKQDMHFRGLSPSGLPLGDRDKDYQGHVMWDQELWMFPPILLFHSTLSTIILNSRNRLVSGAKVNSQQGKVKGLMFPWESGRTGIELNQNRMRGATSPFVSAGIVLAVQQLLYATNYSVAIARQYGQMVTGIGHFLVSTKLSCKEDKCSVNDVLPFDDSNGVVNNSPFVNEIVRSALFFVSKMDFSRNFSDPNHWNRFASEIVSQFDETTEFHPAYDFYRKDSRVSEADAVLLGYPLMRKMHKDIRTKDLHYYESVLDPRASPMTWAMHTIGWLESGDHARANPAFQRQLLFIRNEFQVWSNRTLGVQHASNYLPAAGTYLQSLVNGFGGVRLHSDRLDLDPSLPDGVNEMDFIGIDYLGSSINFVIRKDEVLVLTTGQLRNAAPLTLYVHEPEEVHRLNVQQVVRLRRRKISIFRADSPLPDFRET